MFFYNTCRMAFSAVRMLSYAVFQTARTKTCTGLHSGSVFLGLKAGQASFHRPSNLRSIWSVSNCGVQRNTPLLMANENGCSCKNGLACKLHTTGDHDLAEFLKDEIKVEKDIEKKSGKLPKIKDFEVTKTDGPRVVLTRKIDHETITVKISVNDSMEDSEEALEGEQQDETQGSQMVSRPAFVVEINKGGDKTLAVRCIFPPPDDVPPPTEQDQQEQYEDLIEIQEVALLSKSQEWTEDVYTLSGSVMDGNLYDMLLKLLEERGIDADFLDQVVEFSTSYEHMKYIELLEHLKDFANSK